MAVNIKSDRDGIRRDAIFDTYISDKKRIVSYNLGMTFAKLYAEKLLNIRDLVHIEFLKKNNAISFSSSSGKRSKEPDLVGQCKNNLWHLFEAKGISSSPNQLNVKINEAKAQLSQVNNIYGRSPTTRTACATYIGDDRILSLLVDPTDNGERNYEINYDNFLNAYYSPFLMADSLDLPRYKEIYDGHEIDIFELSRSRIKLSIGLPSEIVGHLKNNSNRKAEHISSYLDEFSKLKDLPLNSSIGLDGFLIKYSEY